LKWRIREHFEGEMPTIMPRRQIIPKIDPVNCLCSGRIIIGIEILNVNMARRHRPNNETPIK